MSELTAEVGRPFTVRLADRPGSGHMWAFDDLPPGVRFVDRSSAGRSSQVGGTSTVEFRFVMERAGTADLVFRLSRSWEPAEIDVRRVRVTAER